MENKIKYIVSDIEKNLRIDVFINKRNKELSRTRVKNLILDGNVEYNSEPLNNPSKKINVDDLIIVKIPEPKKYL